jgi:endonuclease YncB( thermonuclease family)
MIDLLVPKALRSGRRGLSRKRPARKRLLWGFLVLAALFAGVAHKPLALPTWVSDTATGTPAAPVATSFEGRVVRVSDGDSLQVLVDRQQISLRLEGIDAPERGQPWSSNARQALVAMVAGRDVRVTVSSRDRYGRSIASVRAPSDSGPVNVNLEMVASGSAWVYRAYSRDPAKLAAEADARRSGRGLWSLPESQRLPPWDYRRQQRQNSVAGR